MRTIIKFPIRIFFTLVLMPMIIGFWALDFISNKETSSGLDVLKDIWGLNE